MTFERVVSNMRRCRQTNLRRPRIIGLMDYLGVALGQFAVDQLLQTVHFQVGCTFYNQYPVSPKLDQDIDLPKANDCFKTVSSFTAIFKQVP